MTPVMLFWLIYSAKWAFSCYRSNHLSSFAPPNACFVPKYYRSWHGGGVNILQARCRGRYSRVILYGTHSSLDIQAFVYVWPVNSQAQLPPGRRSGAFCRADDLLMWIPVRQKGKCLCFQDSLVSRVSTAVTLSPVLPKPSRSECNTISSGISSADAPR